MIESSYYNESIKTKIIEYYLKKKSLNNIEYLILGCTHYPLIEKEIKRIYKENINIINALSHTSKYIMQFLEKENILAKKKLIQ